MSKLVDGLFAVQVDGLVDGGGVFPLADSRRSSRLTVFFAFFGLFRLGFSALSGVEAVTASLFRFFFDMSSISSPAHGLCVT